LPFFFLSFVGLVVVPVPVLVYGTVGSVGALLRAYLP